jgi:hypothetical protein
MRAYVGYAGWSYDIWLGTPPQTLIPGIIFAASGGFGLR